MNGAFGLPAPCASCVSCVCVYRASCSNATASTWRAATDAYSQELNTVLRETDHICPFTGTAITARNMHLFILIQVVVIALGFGVAFVTVWGLVVLFRF